MPYRLETRGDQTCVVNSATGADVPGGCHASRVKATMHMRALYTNVPDARTASGSVKVGVEDVVGGLQGLIESGAVTLTASAAAFPLKPPREWFDTPEPDQPQPLVVHDDGHVTGHLAPWSGCHTAYGQCIPPPRSADGYANFHVGALETAEGDVIPVGKVMFGGKHASTDPSVSLAAASQHYDDNGHVGAYVRATDGRHGIWLTGALKHDITPEGLRDLRANPPSGDWRDRNGRHTLIAALAVPVPGFPIERPLAASGELPAALIMSYPVEETDVEPRSKDYLRKRALIASSLEPK